MFPVFPGCSVNKSTSNQRHLETCGDISDCRSDLWRLLAFRARKPVLPSMLQFWESHAEKKDLSAQNADSAPPTEKDDKFPAFGEVAKLRRKPEIKATQVRTVCSQVSESQRKLAEQISTTPGCFDLCSSRVREVICPLLRCIQMLILG